MRLPASCIQSWSQFRGGNEALSHHLHAIGFEVDECIPQKLEFSGVVVGRVTACRAHPDAKRLKLASVQIDESEQKKPLTIVCGAPNCQEGLTVACALPGARLPGLASPLSKARLRGIESEGMLCGASELGLELPGQDEGIWSLPSHLKLGTPLSELLVMEDEIWQIPVPANRTDCHSVFGLSREIVGTQRGGESSMLGLPIQPGFERSLSPMVFPFEVEVSDPNTLHYEMAYLEGLTPNFILAPRRQQMLASSGLGLPHPWVAELNLTTLEVGQPFHAFDADLIEGKLQVRQAQPGEFIELLNGTELQFTENFMPTVIADSKGVLCLAGIMGGTRAKLSPQTHRILIESAAFEPKSIARTLKATQLSTASSHRFERGVDPSLTSKALHYAVQQLWEASKSHDPGKSLTVVRNFRQQAPEARPWIQVRMEKSERLLGEALDHLECFPRTLSALQRLGLAVEWAPSLRKLKVQPPLWRQELQIEEDVIETMARLRGYTQIPSTPLPLPIWGASKSKAKSCICDWDEVSAIREHLTHRGFFEVKNFALTSQALQKQLMGDSIQDVKIPEPLSQSLNALRYSLIPGLINNAQYNQARHSHTLKLFEVATTFEVLDGKIQEIPRLCLLLSPGPELHWRSESQLQTAEGRYFEVKAVLESWLHWRGLGQEHLTELSGCPHWAAPNQSLQLQWGGLLELALGNLHPSLQKSLNLKNPVTLAEVKWKQFLPKVSAGLKLIQRPWPFPTSRRVVTLVVPEGLSSLELMQVARASLENSFCDETSLDLSSLYLPPAQTALAQNRRASLTLEIQGRNENLSDAQIETGVQLWLNRIEKLCGAYLAPAKS